MEFASLRDNGLKLLKKDASDNPILDEDGNEIKYGVTLLEYARKEALILSKYAHELDRRKITNLDIFNRRVLIPHPTRWHTMQLLAHSRIKQERLGNTLVSVFKREKLPEVKGRFTIHAETFEVVGFFTLGDASKRISIDQSLLDHDIDKEYDGIFSSMGYVFFSKARVERIIKKHGLDCAIEDLVDCMNYDHDLAIDICDILNDQNTDTFDKSDFLAAMAAMKKEDTAWKNPLTE